MINNNKYFRHNKDYYPIFYEIITEELNSKTDNIVELWKTKKILEFLQVFK